MTRWKMLFVSLFVLGAIVLSGCGGYHRAVVYDTYGPAYYPGSYAYYGPSYRGYAPQRVYVAPPRAGVVVRPPVRAYAPAPRPMGRVHVAPPVGRRY